MKKSLIIMLCAFSCSSLYAQQWQTRNFKYYNSQIDSIVTVYSADTFKRTSDFQLTFHDFGLRVDLSVKERKKLIEKVKKLFEQDKYLNLYFVGHKLIYEMSDMFPVPNPPEINQALLDLYFQYYFYPGRYSYTKRENYHDLNMKKNFTPKTKKRIIEILENKKTEKEFDLWLEYHKSISSYTEDSWNDAKRIMKRREFQNDTVLAQIRDSLFNANVYMWAKRDFNLQQIEPNLIRTIGFLDMKECIPTLKQQLSDCIKNDCDNNRIRAYRYALARMGDQEQRQYILDNYMDIWFNRNDFAYFRDDEMVWLYIKQNYDTEKRIRTESAGRGDGTLCSYITMREIYPLVKNNVPEELQYKPFSLNKDWEILLYEWLMENKDTVEFDYNTKERGFW